MLTLYNISHIFNQRGLYHGQSMWTTTVDKNVIRLCEQVGLQPYYSNQEQAIERFYNAIKNENREPITMNKSKYIVVKKDGL